MPRSPRLKARYRAAGRRVRTAPSCPTSCRPCWSSPPPPTWPSGSRCCRSTAPGLELLRLALLEAGTPYAAPVEAVCALLPGPSPADVAAAKALARTGPPREQVGLDLAPFGLHTRRRHRDDAVDVLLWGVLPYVVVAVLVGGTIWRYRYDQFGWTTRSSQLYESRLLRIGSPLFHFGLLVVIVGHVDRPASSPRAGPTPPGSARRPTTSRRSCSAASPGFCTLVGVGILIYRRRTTGPVFMATTRNDKLMYVVLVAAIVAGLTTTLLGAAGGEEHNYRLTVSPWFRSLFVLQPDVAAMSRAGLAFQLHAADRHGCCSRSGRSPGSCTPSPRRCGYLFRPYVVYRSREAGTAARRPRPGWEAVGPEASRRR